MEIGFSKTVEETWVNLQKNHVFMRILMRKICPNDKCNLLLIVFQIANWSSSVLPTFTLCKWGESRKFTVKTAHVYTWTNYFRLQFDGKIGSSFGRWGVISRMSSISVGKYLRFYSLLDRFSFALLQILLQQYRNIVHSTISVLCWTLGPKLPTLCQLEKHRW